MGNGTIMDGLNIFWIPPPQTHMLCLNTIGFLTYSSSTAGYLLQTRYLLPYLLYLTGYCLLLMYDAIDV